MTAIDASTAHDRLPDIRVVEFSSHDLRAHLDRALAIYVEAMGYPPGTEAHRAPMWIEHTHRPGWKCVGALDPAGSLVAIAYGYRGAPGQWWHRQVREGMRRTGWDRRAAESVLADYFELTEIHVCPAAQGHRLGEALVTTLLSGRRENIVMLSTPEVAGEDNRAWRLYRRLGFRDIVRRFHFAGDTRPFAVLGHDLPLDSRHAGTDLPGIGQPGISQPDISQPNERGTLT